MSTLTRTTVAAAMMAVFSVPAFASDARTIALGGSVVANGVGAHGAHENPSALARMKRDGQQYHFRFGFSGEARDEANAIETFQEDENRNLLSDIEREIDTLSARPITCDPLNPDQTQVCLTETQAVADLSTRLLGIIEQFDEKGGSGRASVNLGAALTGFRFPVAVNYSASATGFVTPDISDSDSDYIREFENLLSDNQLTLSEAAGSSFLQTNALGLPLSVSQPEDILTSTGEAHVLTRNQFSISVGHSFELGGFSIDAGITPKFSSFKTNNTSVSVSSEFEDGGTSAADRFEDSETSDSSFTFDVGGAMQLSKFPVRVAAVLRNVVPESVTDDSGYEFETTPQLIVGGHMQKGIASFTADLALNEAKVDNFETQRLAIGVEIGAPHLAFRAGINHDTARENDATSLSLGAGLGPVHLGARLTSLESIEAGLQFSYSY